MRAIFQAIWGYAERQKANVPETYPGALDKVSHVSEKYNASEVEVAKWVWHIST